jgi:YD repeat-containing protein
MKAERNFFVCLLLSLFLTACGGGGGDSDNGGGGDSVSGKKLLSKISVEGEGGRSFRYDNQNRLIADSALGEGSKIEYQGDDIHPSLVTGDFCQTCQERAAYAQYQYGTDELNGIPTKYYQAQLLDQNKEPISNRSSLRYYLNLDDRIIAIGSSGISYTYTYDDRGNLLKKVLTSGGGGLGITETTLECAYGDKKSPASEMATPLWWFGDLNASGDFLYSPNNPLSCTDTSVRMFGGIVVQVFYVATRTYSYTYDQDGYLTAADVTRAITDDEDGEWTTNYRRTFEYIPAH